MPYNLSFLGGKGCPSFRADNRGVTEAKVANIQIREQRQNMRQMHQNVETERESATKPNWKGVLANQTTKKYIIINDLLMKYNWYN